MLDFKGSFNNTIPAFRQVLLFFAKFCAKIETYVLNGKLLNMSNLALPGETILS